MCVRVCMSVRVCACACVHVCACVLNMTDQILILIPRFHQLTETNSDSSSAPSAGLWTAGQQERGTSSPFYCYVSVTNCMCFLFC